MRNEYMCSGHPTIQDPAHVPEEFDDPFDHKALAFQYLEETYTLWLDLQDDFTEWNQIMEERYRRHFYCEPWIVLIFLREEKRKSTNRVGWTGRPAG